MNLRERHLLCAWQAYVTRLHMFFVRETKTKAMLADFYAAIHNEVIYLRRQYPGVKEKKIVDRAYSRLLEAYKRSIEYPVFLNWPSLAVFVAHRRPGIAWAVLQARADYRSKEKPVIKNNEKPFMVKKVRSVQMAFCPFCHVTAKLSSGKFLCCGKELIPKDCW